MAAATKGSVMTSRVKGKHAPDCVQLSYQLIRNTTSPDEKSIGVQSFVANAPAAEILKVQTKANLRSYLGEYSPRKRNRVHEAMRATMESQPERFIIRNSGFVVTATEVAVDDNAKVVTLTDASLINGAQSQGEVRSFLADTSDEGDLSEMDDVPFYVRLTIIIDPDAAQVAETAIARNIATPIKSLTEANARGQLNDLASSVKEVRPDIKIRMTESDADGIDARKVLQLARLLMPASVSGNTTAAEKLRPYKNPEQCLTDFCEWFETKGTNPISKAKYDFTVEIAPYALIEYEKWECHQDWNKQNMWEKTKKGGRALRRDKKTKKIIWISPSILFPIMGAMSEFVVKDKKGNWQIQKPKIFKEEEMIRRAATQFHGHESNPILMGRSESAYDALRIYPQTLVDILHDISANT
jgi:AIPR protein